MQWIYTLTVKPPVTYAATGWWPGVKFKTSKAELSKLQRLACLGIIGAIRTPPTAATEVLLRFPPLQLQLVAEVKAGIYRLYCSKQRKPIFKGYGHVYMSRGMKELIPQMETNKIIPRHVSNVSFIDSLTEVNERRVSTQQERGTSLVHRQF